jgi:Holliday junction resolvase-like predicted endonuclease
VPAKRRRRIVRAAQYWLGHPTSLNHDIAFDVVLTRPEGPQHIANAFPV